MPTVVRALLDRDPPPTLTALWRDRDIIGLGNITSGLETWRGDRVDPALVWLARHQTDTTT